MEAGMYLYPGVTFQRQPIKLAFSSVIQLHTSSLRVERHFLRLGDIFCKSIKFMLATKY